MTNLRILLLATTALTATQLATSASHAQTAPLVVAQAREEGALRAPGRRRRRRRRTEGPAAATGCCAPRPAAAPPPPPAAAPPRVRPRPATACCGSATASSATPAASGGCASSASDATSAAPGCRAEGADSAPAAPGGCTFAPDAAAAASTGSRACGAEATGRTDDATPHRRLHLRRRRHHPCRPAAPPWRQAAAGTCHHAGSNSAADGRPATWRKHDGATAASRRTDDASECGRPGNCTDHTAGATRRAAACRPSAGGVPAAPGATPPAAPTTPGGAAPTAPTAVPGVAECRATSRPGPKRPADRCAGFPPGASSHRTAASGSAAGSRRDQSHCPGYAAVRTATP